LNTWNFKRLLAQKYDIVVTNPPYMGSSGMGAKMSDFVKNNYPDSKNDLFAVFIEKCSELLKPTGYQAMITQHAWMFLSSFEKLRGKLIHRDIVNMAHLGSRAFEEIGGEVVQTTAFVLSKRSIADYEAVFVRLVDFNSQEAKEEAFLSGDNLYTAKKENFEKMPGCPVAYWVSEKFIRAFENGKLLGDLIPVKKGMDTGDNDYFLKFWFEINQDKFDYWQWRKKWIPYDKGGNYRKWFGNNDYVVNWENNGYELKNSKANLRSQHLYFKDSITWNALSSANTCFRYSMYKGSFDSAGSSMFPNKNEINIFLGFMNSRIAQYYLNVINPTLNYGSGSMAQVPIIKNEVHKPKIDSLVEENISLSKTDWDSFETSWDFEKHPLLNFGVSIYGGLGSMENGEYNSQINLGVEKTDTSFKIFEKNTPKNYRIQSAFEMWKEYCDKRFNTLKANEEELNRIFIDIYGLSDELRPEVEEKEVTVRRADLGREIRSLISYAVGCMFGRYSLDTGGLAYAGGEWVEDKYISFIPDKDNILPICDDEYFDDDILRRFVDFVRVVYGLETLEENLKYIADALGGKGTPREVIRNYFLNDFYKDHCRIYQKRPIYWLFDSGKQNGFKALIYMHRYDENTIGNLRIDYLHRMQRIYENEIARMQDTIENSKNAREVTAATKRKEKLIKQLQETKEYDEKIAHLALARTSIDLDDGVKVNYEKVQTDRDGKKLDVLAKI